MVRRVLAYASAVVILGFVYLAPAQSYHPRALHIQASWSPPSGNGACGGGTLHPCNVFSSDGDVEIGVALTNISDQPLTFRNLRWTAKTEFEVRDEEGNLASETEELKKYKQEFYKDGEWSGHRVGQMWRGPLPDDKTTLKPSGQVSWGVCLNRYYDMSRPGTYSIIAKLRGDEPTQEWFYSNEIRVTITQGIKSTNSAVSGTSCKPL